MEQISYPQITQTSNLTKYNIVAAKRSVEMQAERERVVGEFPQKPLLDSDGSIAHADMKLPNSHLAIVERKKIAEYLLNTEHLDNGGKALFFISLGFSREEWFMLANALPKVVHETEVAISMESSHGIKYIVDGRLSTPSGKSPTVRTVWIVDRGSERPRLVTAYPCGEI